MALVDAQLLVYITQFVLDILFFPHFVPRTLKILSNVVAAEERDQDLVPSDRGRDLILSSADASRSFGCAPVCRDRLGPNDMRPGKGNGQHQTRRARLERTIHQPSYVHLQTLGCNIDCTLHRMFPLLIDIILWESKPASQRDNAIKHSCRYHPTAS